MGFDYWNVQKYSLVLFSMPKTRDKIAASGYREEYITVLKEGRCGCTPKISWVTLAYS